MFSTSSLIIILRVYMLELIEIIFEIIWVFALGGHNTTLPQDIFMQYLVIARRNSNLKV